MLLSFTCIYTGQLQLMPAAEDLVQSLASLPLQLAGWEAAEQGLALADADRPAGPSGTMGTTLHYMLEAQQFAQGGFGEVWRAEHRADQRGGLSSEDRDEHFTNAIKY